MLQIVVPPQEDYDSVRNEFIQFPGQTLQLEHSLVSISKWESKWKIRFLDPMTKMNMEQELDYIRCMTITQNVNPDVYSHLTRSNRQAIKDYINDPMTATTFYGHDNDKKGKRSREPISSELIYYWMVAYQIPFECQKWHLNRLLTLIRIAGIKNQPDKKQTRADRINQAKSNAALNAARKKRLGTKG